MANYNKSFNFRNGVQVDDDNFVVNANGLVGIGTSIPRQFLDVYGTAKVTGLVTTTNLAVSGVSTFYSDVKVGSGITISPSTGAVSATTFYGSAAGLTGFYAIAVSGWYVDTANSGIFTSFKVGIGTTNPQYSLQVGQNPLTGNGFSVDSATGNVKTTGIVTAIKFSGPGDEVTSINASAITSGTLDNARLPSNISVGIVTAATFNGSLTGTATTASNLTGTPNISVTNVTSTNINNTGIVTSANLISGISSVGVSTVSTRLYAESIGVGTNSPSSDVHIRRTSVSKLQVTSDAAEAIVTVGRSITLTGNNGALRFGNTSALQRYSNGTSLDIINYSTGNINSYLQLGSAGINTGSFNWFYGQTVPNSPLMTLTYGGNLGIGVTLPTNNLHVVGTSTVTSNSYVGGNLYLANNLYVNGGLTLSTLNASLTGNVTGNLTGNVYSSAGISTFNDLNSTGTLTSNLLTASNKIGIRTSNARAELDVLEFNSIFGTIGVGTDNSNSAVDFSNAGKNIDDTLSFMLPPKVSSADRVGLTTVEGGVIYNTTVRRLELYLGNGRGWVGIATVV